MNIRELIDALEKEEAFYGSDMEVEIVASGHNGTFSGIVTGMRTETDLVSLKNVVIVLADEAQGG